MKRQISFALAALMALSLAACGGSKEKKRIRRELFRRYPRREGCRLQ